MGDTEKSVENERSTSHLTSIISAKENAADVSGTLIKKKYMVITRRQGSEAESFKSFFLKDGTDSDWFLISRLTLLVCQQRWTLGDPQPWLKMFNHGRNDPIEGQTPVKK